MLVNRIFIVFFPISFLLRFYSVLILADSLLCLTVTKMDIHMNLIIVTVASLSLVSVPIPLFFLTENQKGKITSMFFKKANYFYACLVAFFCP